MPDAPWKSDRGVSRVVREWLEAGKVRSCLAAERTLPAAEARRLPVPRLQAGVREALRRRGIEGLYSHQVQAIEAALGGKHVVVATPTASGKSLCFHLPVIEALATDPSASALFLYPTKALSRDQEHNLQSLLTDSGVSAAATVYDGDTPGDARRAVRERSRVVLTNPDMLHAGILPNHARWASWLSGLRYVVLDELHTYRGVFGSHMAHVIARLKRIAAFHGANPTFICATATIGNPREHTARFLGVDPEEVELVSESGAPRNQRRVLVYNPPVVNAELGIRKSSLKAAVHLTADLIEARVPTIVFAPSRNSVEVMLKYLREDCGHVAGPEAIMGYRGGYLPERRRAIERGLRDGEILCVVATNALELGIDIGDLEAVVCVGYPGSVAGTWQRFGRAGRRGTESIALLVCSSGAVDQYLAREPAYLLDGGAEEARIEPENVEIVVQHLKCALFEAPFVMTAPGSRPASPEPAEGERYGTMTVEETRAALDYLVGHGLAHAARGRYHWAGDAFPANHVSLRSIGWDNFVIIDQETEQTIGELDWRAAHTMLHEQAIYQQDAEQYQVERLDFDNHKAFVRKVAPDYFTTALTYRTVTVIEPEQDDTAGRALLGWGEVKVIEKVTGYKKIKFFTHENAGYGDVHLPEMQMHTTSFWLTVPEPVLEELAVPRALAVDALRGLGAALETVASLALMCDPRDLGQTLGDGAQDGAASLEGALEAPPARSAEERGAETEHSAETERGAETEHGARTEPSRAVPPPAGTEPLPPGRDPHAGRTGGLDPTLFLFDAIPGGVGLAQRIFERAPELLGRARHLLERCPCELGCPACVGPSEGRRKELALALLDALRVPRAAGRELLH